MIINLIYIFTILVGIYFAIQTYIETKHRIIRLALAILVASLVLERQWMDIGNFLIDTTDFFRTLRDIVRTILMIVAFHNIHRLKK